MQHYLGGAWFTHVACPSAFAIFMGSWPEKSIRSKPFLESALKLDMYLVRMFAHRKQGGVGVNGEGLGLDLGRKKGNPVRQALLPLSLFPGRHTCSPVGHAWCVRITTCLATTNRNTSTSRKSQVKCVGENNRIYIGPNRTSRCKGTSCYVTYYRTLRRQNRQEVFRHTRFRVHLEGLNDIWPHLE